MPLINKPKFDTGIQQPNTTWKILPDPIIDNKINSYRSSDPQQAQLRQDTNDNGRLTPEMRNTQADYTIGDQRRERIGNTLKNFGMNPKLPFTDPLEFGKQVGQALVTQEGLGFLGRGLKGVVKEPVDNVVNNTSKSIINPIENSSKLSQDLEPYISRRTRNMGREEEVFNSFLSPEKQLQKQLERTTNYDKSGNELNKWKIIN